MAGLTNFSAATDIVIAAQGWDMAAWAERVRAADPGRRVSIAPEVPSPGEIAYALVWRPPEGFFRMLPNLRAIFFAGSGRRSSCLPRRPA